MGRASHVDSTGEDHEPENVSPPEVPAPLAPMRPTNIPLPRTAKTVQTMYTVLAPLYDRVVPLVSSTARTRGLSWLDVQNGEYVLEMGTGTGLAFAQLVSANPDGWTVGVDLTPAMLRRARTRVADEAPSHYDLHRAHAAALPYPDDAFNAVFSSYLLDTLSARDLLSTVEEMTRVLRPGGRLVLVHLAPPQSHTERIWEILSRYLPHLLGGARPLRLRPLLRRSGLSILKHTTCVQAGLRSAITQATIAPA